MKPPWRFITNKGYSHSHGNTIISYLLHTASHKYWLEFDNSAPAKIWTWISWDQKWLPYHCAMLHWQIFENLKLFLTKINWSEENFLSRKVFHLSSRWHSNLIQIFPIADPSRIILPILQYFLFAAFSWCCHHALLNCQLSIKCSSWLLPDHDVMILSLYYIWERFFYFL